VAVCVHCDELLRWNNNTSAGRTAAVHRLSLTINRELMLCDPIPDRRPGA